MRKSKKKDSGGGANWMDTYGDMVTLLLTFFVLLYSFSTVDATKWEKLVAALGGKSNVMLSDSGLIEHQNDMLNYPGTESQEQEAEEEGEDKSLEQLQAELQEKLDQVEELYKKIKAYVSESEFHDDIMVTRTDSEIRIKFTNNVLFDLGKANIKPEAINILSEITDAINTYNQAVQIVRIEGHTDNLPISTPQFPSNWELSTERAVSVLRYMLDVKQVRPEILSAVGYGEYRPFADNSTEEGRRMNRRVDFVIEVVN